VSVQPDGRPSVGYSSATDVTPDGRYVAFATDDSNVQSKYKLATGQVYMFVRDMRTGTTSLECLSSTGAVANNSCVNFAEYTGHFMSADGRYLVFSSSASNTLRSRQPATKPMRSTSATGSGGRLPESMSPTTVPERQVAHGWHGQHRHLGQRELDRVSSGATNLSRQSTDGHQRSSCGKQRPGALWLASASNGGRAATTTASEPSLTTDGSVVAFESSATNFLSHDANAGQCPANIGANCSNVYVHANVG